MRTTAEILKTFDLPARDAYDLPASRKRFADGGQYRVEIPSCEGPRALEAIGAAADEHAVPIHRISQGSGIMLQTDDEIRAMVALGAARAMEVCLFVGPRANWDTGVQASSASGRVLGCSLRGIDQLVYGLEDVRHAAGLGIRSVLVADIGQLSILGRMKSAGDLPPDFVLKVSVTLAAANPASARVLEDLGATSINLPVDLSLPQIAAIRAAVDAADRFLRRGAGRLRRHRAALRDPGARPDRRADLPEVRPPQRARHLPGGPASGIGGAGALARARPPRGNRPGHSPAVRAGRGRLAAARPGLTRRPRTG